jgi:radical SAM superfamily enzyme YgiQ (UPF0313 family)
MSNLRKHFKIRTVEEVKKDLEIAAKKSYSSSIQKLFFLDGNAMVTPTDKLLELTKHAMKILPNLKRIGVYAHAKDILKKSDSDLRELSDAGLKIAYVGFESGYDSLLKEIHKHATKDEYINASNKLFKANITLSATFINGLGGSGNAEVSKAHAVESADLVNQICPNDDRVWYIAFLSLMIPPGTVIYEKKKKGGFIEMNSNEILNELKIFIEAINFKNKYANCIFRSNHASNYLPIRGTLEKDKAKILEIITYALNHEEVLRPDYYRAL